jgi:hypothetical protein
MAAVEGKLMSVAAPAHPALAGRREVAEALTEAITLKGVDCTWDAAGLDVVFRESGSSFEATPEALGLPTDWRSAGRIEAEVEAVEAPLRVELVVVGPRGRLPGAHDFGAGETATIAVDLADLPLTAGIKPAYEPAGVRVVARYLGGETTRHIRVRRLTLVERDGDAGPCVDRFGQRIRASWPGKIEREEDLAAGAAREAEELARMDPPPNRDEFCGWTAGPKFGATGFFRIERDGDGRWWLVDPLGRPFWSVGLTGIRTAAEATAVEGREELFEALPEKDGPHAGAWSDEGVSFYAWNALRRHGSVEAWRDRVCERFRRWGVNTIGAYSEPVALEQQVIPHTRIIRTRGGAMLHGNPRGMPDVFDPAWEAWLDGHLADETAPARDDPWLVGWFVDNERPWGRLRLLDAAPDSAAKRAWIEFQKRRHGDLDSLGREWGMAFDDWDEVGRLTDADVPEEGPAREAVRAFDAEYAETYFQTVARLLRRHDPNHLYLGCRFVRKAPHPWVARAARHADVVSVNCYALYPERKEFHAWHEMTGRPVLIGEHDLPLKSERQVEPVWDAFTASECRRYYVKFLKEFARMPFAVGSHWFQHADQPLTGRWQNGENQPIGFVDVTDRPHRHKVEAVREVAANVYAWHSAAE